MRVRSCDVCGGRVVESDREIHHVNIWDLPGREVVLAWTGAPDDAPPPTDRLFHSTASQRVLAAREDGARSRTQDVGASRVNDQSRVKGQSAPTPPKDPNCKPAEIERAFRAGWTAREMSAVDDVTIHAGQGLHASIPGPGRYLIIAADTAPNRYASPIQLCVEHWNGGQANEDDYGLLSYCPAEGHRDTCRVVDAQIAIRDQI